MVPAPGSAGVCPMLPTLGLMGPALTCATGEDPEGLVGSSPAPAQTKLSLSEVPGASHLWGPWGQPPGTRGLYQDNSPPAPLPAPLSSTSGTSEQHKSGAGADEQTGCRARREPRKAAGPSRSGPPLHLQKDPALTKTQRPNASSRAWHQDAGREEDVGTTQVPGRGTKQEGPKAGPPQDQSPWTGCSLWGPNWKRITVEGP